MSIRLVVYQSDRTRQLIYSRYELLCSRSGVVWLSWYTGSCAYCSASFIHSYIYFWACMGTIYLLPTYSMSIRFLILRSSVDQFVHSLILVSLQVFRLENFLNLLKIIIVTDSWLLWYNFRNRFNSSSPLQKWRLDPSLWRESPAVQIRIPMKCGNVQKEQSTKNWSVPSLSEYLCPR